MYQAFKFSLFQANHLNYKFIVVLFYRIKDQFEPVATLLF